MKKGSDDTGLVLAANRGPFSYVRDGEGRLVTRRGGGGLVTALLGLSATHEVTWIASAMSADDAASAAAGLGGGEVEYDGHRLRLRLLVHDDREYHRFYNEVANPLIWFIQHYLWNLPLEPVIGREAHAAWEHGYQAVNRRFAAAICDEIGRGRAGRPLVMLHDYHLYTCPAMVRQRCAGAFLHHFVHIPWPQPDAWRILPRRMREEIFTGLLANDIVAFHTRAYRDNFLDGCERLAGLEVDRGRSLVRVEGREVWVRAYPVSIDCEDFDRLAESGPVLAAEERIAAARRGKLILRVDRLDLSKNIVRGFLAYDVLLERHPELKGEVTFLALLQPSRQDIPEYAAYRQRVEEVAAGINERHGTGEWLPVDLRLQDDFPCSVAAYKQYDVLLVNPVFDGMNLIAKEAGLVNRRNGVLVLSENAGAHEELAEGVISVNPFDVEGQAEALYRALTMDEDEKGRLAGMIRKTVRGNDVGAWIRSQLRDIETRMGGKP